MTQINLLTKQKQAHRLETENKLTVPEGERE